MGLKVVHITKNTVRIKSFSSKVLYLAVVHFILVICLAAVLKLKTDDIRAIVLLAAILAIFHWLYFRHVLTRFRRIIRIEADFVNVDGRIIDRNNLKCIFVQVVSVSIVGFAMTYRVGIRVKDSRGYAIGLTTLDSKKEALAVGQKIASILIIPFANEIDR